MFVLTLLFEIKLLEILTEQSNISKYLWEESHLAKLPKLIIEFHKTNEIIT